MRASASTTSTPTRTASRSWSTSAPSRTPGSSRTSTSSGCGRQADRARRTSSGSGSPRVPGRSSTERLIDEPIELPRINYGRCNERPYRYVWGVGAGERLARPDREGRRRSSGTLDVWSRTGCFPGEPVFVAAPDGRGRGRGRPALGRVRRRRGQLVPARARCAQPRRGGPGGGPAPHPVRVPRAVCVSDRQAAPLWSEGRSPKRLVWGGRLRSRPDGEAVYAARASDSAYSPPGSVHQSVSSRPASA